MLFTDICVECSRETVFHFVMVVKHLRDYLGRYINLHIIIIIMIIITIIIKIYLSKNIPEYWSISKEAFEMFKGLTGFNVKLFLGKTDHLALLLFYGKNSYVQILNR